MGSIAVARRDTFKPGQPEVASLQTSKGNCSSKLNTRVRNQNNITADVIVCDSSRFNLGSSANCMSLPWNEKCDVGHVLIEFNMRKTLVFLFGAVSIQREDAQYKQPTKKEKSNIYSVNY